MTVYHVRLTGTYTGKEHLTVCRHEERKPVNEDGEKQSGGGPCLEDLGRVDWESFRIDLIDAASQQQHNHNNHKGNC